MKRVRNFVPFIILAYKYCQKKCEARWLRWPKTSIILSMSFSRVLLVCARSMQRKEIRFLTRNSPCLPKYGSFSQILGTESSLFSCNGMLL